MLEKISIKKVSRVKPNSGDKSKPNKGGTIPQNTLK